MNGENDLFDIGRRAVRQARTRNHRCKSKSRFEVVA